MQKDLADFCVRYALKKGASYSEARLERYTGNGFVLKNGNPSISGFDVLSGIGVRLVINKTLGFVAINQLDKKEIKRAIDKGIKITRASSKIGDSIKFSSEDLKKANYKVKQRIKLNDVSPEEKLKALMELDKDLKDVKHRYFSYSDNIIEKYFTNSEGIKISAEIPTLSIFYYLTLMELGNSIQRYWQYGNSGGWEFFKKWDLNKKLSEEIKALNNNLKFGKKAPKGEIDVVVGPEVTGLMVHESAGHPYEADRIFGREAAQAGESFINKEMVGQQIGSEIVNVVDDPTMENNYGFYLYDDEGVKARRRFLIKNGKINEFLHNRETAYVMGLRSNGSARANNYNVEAIVRMGNTFMLPGDYNEDEIIKEVKEGVFIKNFSEWNIDDVRLNQRYVGNEAYLIKNGEIKNPIKRPAIEITTPRLYKSIDAIGKKIEFHAATCGKGEPEQGIRVWHGGPMVRIKGIRLR